MSPPAASSPAQQRSIAIVCAPGDAAGEVVSAFARQLDLSPALHALPKGGSDAAALEALESARGAGYAIVLAGEGVAVSPLQIGFLLGLVGRNRLCFLGAGEAAVAGLDAVPRHNVDAGGLWRLLLAREMKQSGLDVDLNRAM
jgi:hypothetical protein